MRNLGHAIFFLTTGLTVVGSPDGLQTKLTVNQHWARWDWQAVITGTRRPETNWLRLAQN